MRHGLSIYYCAIFPLLWIASEPETIDLKLYMLDSYCPLDSYLRWRGRYLTVIRLIEKEKKKTTTCFVNLGVIWESPRLKAETDSIDWTLRRRVLSIFRPVLMTHADLTLKGVGGGGEEGRGWGVGRREGGEGGGVINGSDVKTRTRSWAPIRDLTANYGAPFVK